jgi:germination protein M
VRWLIWIALSLLALVLLGLWVTRPREEPARIYFVQWDADRNTGRLVAVPRRVRGRTQADRVAEAVRLLLRGPSEAERRLGYTTEIPAGTRLRGVRIEGEVVTVDLSRDLERGGGSSSMLARVYQIVYTATQFQDIRAVQILLDGERRDALGGEGVWIGGPIRRPDVPPEF